jgi:hypothetical protein
MTMIKFGSIALGAVVLAACGSVSNPVDGDSGPGGDGDPGADASRPGPMTVRVLTADGKRNPAPDTPVGFFGPDGELIEVVDTDGDGLASAEMLPGGAAIAFVSAEVLGGAPSLLRAWAVLDVHPGDAITLGGPGFGLGDRTASMTLQVNSLEGASSYQAETPCGYFPGSPAAGGLIPIVAYQGCDDSPFPFVAWVQTSGTNDDGHHSIVERAVDLAAGGSFASSKTWVRVPRHELHLVDLPGDLRHVRAHFHRGRVAGVLLGTSLPGVDAKLSGDSVELGPLRIAELDDTQLELNILNEQPGLGFQLHHVWIDGGTATRLSGDDLLLPWMTSPLLDLERRSLSWVQVGQQSWDATYLDFIWSRVNEEAGEFQEAVWTIVVPPGRRELSLPPVPPQFASWLPDRVDNAFLYLVAIEHGDIDGWPAARQLGLDPFSGHYQGEPGSTATIRRSFSGSGGPR